MGFPKGRRGVAAVVAALLGVGAVAVVVHRVLAPAEVETVARAGYPSAVNPAGGVVGRLPVAPLIVDGRLRVYTAARQVYADQPADGRYRTSPYWSYRRWPARLSGVVAEGTTVVSHWSDGKLVALDARTGRVAWRADGPAPVDHPAARRTGAGTVWDPPGLFLARSADGRAVLVVSGRRGVRGFALADGRQLWSAGVDDRCRADVGTTAAGQFVAVDRCAGQPAVEYRDVSTGTPTARWQPPGGTAELSATLVGCVSHRSRCRGLRAAGPADAPARGWLVGAGPPVAAPGLDGAGSELAGERVVGVTEGVLTARSVRTGEELWRRGDLGPVRILAAQPGRVHLLTDGNDLVTLDPATGAQRSRFPLTVGRDGLGWAPGLAYAADGYVAVERLREPVDPDADDQRYFLMSEPVVLAAT
ncbi:PQQ-binding-like beta-propeller repeat protein [Micromonospora olivasterospora]|uniref:Putative pyrroloquinoline-quinone binding quinoprotein n=1 Tax=Micromonospora olivasterospora TaxID=1880 RepID=A0A562I7E0_MICOL|nr:PQQ-binding-like beta-propeller repeat protein [Micromonospora olivasterospora]TWH66931.1 putative pyrroloquinoline-quinone binding quinoprotein [Micromonospora olivasterospora]